MRWCTNNCICRFLCRHTQAVILLLVLLLFANQVINFSRDRASHVCYRIVSPFTNHGSSNSSPSSSNNNNTDKNILPNIQWSRARLDDRRMLKIYEWVWPGGLWNRLMNNFNVCLATQGSIDRISSIGEVSEKWLGPISLAVYVWDADELAVLGLFVSYMRKCSVLFSQTVSVHVVVPIDFEIPEALNQSLYFDTSSSSSSSSDDDHPCGQPHEFMSNLINKMLPQRMGGLYPQNHMRNIARKTCGTPWVLMTDVDIIPRPNSSSLLHDFYNSIHSKCQKCAFVLPVFELDKTLPYPSSKKDLIAYVNKGLARQFHLKIYRYGHWATNYSAWMSKNLDEEPIRISHAVDNKMNHYEPFYVSGDDIPKHDERFIGYGFTRSSQVLEARIMGWKFFVLTPIFAIHWGLQTPQSIRSPSLPIPLQAMRSKDKPIIQQGKNSRRSQNLKNHVIYTDFVSELVAKYNISMSRKKAQRKQLQG